MMLLTGLAAAVLPGLLVHLDDIFEGEINLRVWRVTLHFIGRGGSQNRRVKPIQRGRQISAHNMARSTSLVTTQATKGAARKCAVYVIQLRRCHRSRGAGGAAEDRDVTAPCRSPLGQYVQTYVCQGSLDQVGPQRVHSGGEGKGKTLGSIQVWMVDNDGVGVERRDNGEEIGGSGEPFQEQEGEKGGGEELMEEWEDAEQAEAVSLEAGAGHETRVDMSTERSQFEADALQGREEGNDGADRGVGIDETSALHMSDLSPPSKPSKESILDKHKRERKEIYSFPPSRPSTTPARPHTVSADPRTLETFRTPQPTQKGRNQSALQQQGPQTTDHKPESGIRRRQHFLDGPHQNFHPESDIANPRMLSQVAGGPRPKTGSSVKSLMVWRSQSGVGAVGRRSHTAEADKRREWGSRLPSLQSAQA